MRIKLTPGRHSRAVPDPDYHDNPDMPKRPDLEQLPLPLNLPDDEDSRLAVERQREFEDAHRRET